MKKLLIGAALGALLLPAGAAMAQDASANPFADEHCYDESCKETWAEMYVR